MDIEVEYMKFKIRSKQTWKHAVKQNLELMGMEEKDVLDRDYWRFRLTV